MKTQLENNKKGPFDQGLVVRWAPHICGICYLLVTFVTESCLADFQKLLSALLWAFVQ